MTSAHAQATDLSSLQRLFGGAEDLLPLWIAEPYLELATPITEALRGRADMAWYGYEIRPQRVLDAFWTWMAARHGWSGSHLKTSVSPSVATSIAVLIETMTDRGEGVILQPPVFTDFKPLVTSVDRTVVRNPLALDPDGYGMDLDHLEAQAADPANRFMILCNPHNPVGRAWTEDELAKVAAICARHGVFVLADEIHADLVLPPHEFTPFAVAGEGSGVRWAATHGPIKTFGLAGVCDTLLVTSDDEAFEAFQTRSSQLHLTRNNVFGMAAFRAAYEEGNAWLDRLLERVSTNLELLRDGLPGEIELVEPQATYLAWLDFRKLGMDAPEVAEWLASSAHVALSPGHWFGREGAGFARMSVAAPPELIREAALRLTQAVERIR